MNGIKMVLKSRRIGKIVHGGTQLAVQVAKANPNVSLILRAGETSATLTWDGEDFKLDQPGAYYLAPDEELALDALFFVFPHGVSSFEFAEPREAAS